MAGADGLGDANKMARTLAEMGSTASDLARFMADIGENAPLFGTALGVLRVVREKVEKVRYCREELEKLEHRCSNITAGIIDELKEQRRKNPNSTQENTASFSVTDLENLVRKVDGFVDVCSRRRKWSIYRLWKADSDQALIDTLRRDITDQMGDFTAAGMVKMGEKMDAAGVAMAKGINRHTDTASRTTVKDVNRHTDQSVQPLVSVSWCQYTC